MIVRYFSVFDKGVDLFMPPFPARAAGEAIRMFTDEVNNPQSQLSRHPKDFTLYYVGSFDEASGAFDTAEKQRLLGANEVQRPVGNGADPVAQAMAAASPR